MTSKRSRLLPFGLLLLAAAGLAGWWLWRRSQGEQPLLLAGSIEARTVEVGSLVGGRVRTVHVEEGRLVSPGQLLVTLEPDLLELQAAERRAQVEQARAALERALHGPRPEEIERARINWQAAVTDRERFAALYQQGVAPRRDYDRALVAEATARQTVLELERGSRREDVEAARAALSQAEQALAYAERQRREAEITAPSAARVEAIDVRPGDLLAPNQPVATLLEEDQLWVRVWVPDTQLGRVRVGQAAAVRVDTFPERDFPGRVAEIRHQAEYTPRNVQTIEQRADQFFGVKVLIDPTPELHPGMAALVRLREETP